MIHMSVFMFQIPMEWTFIVSSTSIVTFPACFFYPRSFVSMQILATPCYFFYKNCWNLMEIGLSLSLNLENCIIFFSISFLVHESRMSLPLFRLSTIYLIIILYIVAYQTSYNKFVSKHFIHFDTLVNRIVLFHFLTLVCKCIEIS